MNIGIISCNASNEQLNNSFLKKELHKCCVLYLNSFLYNNKACMNRKQCWHKVVSWSTRLLFTNVSSGSLVSADSFRPQAISNYISLKSLGRPETPFLPSSKMCSRLQRRFKSEPLPAEPSVLPDIKMHTRTTLNPPG